DLPNRPEGTAHLTVATVNVNGLRASARKDMAAWAASCDADVVTLQEVRAPDELVADLVAEVFGDGWHVAHSEATAKGRAGVAVVSRLPLQRTHDGADEPCFSGTGRWQEVDLVLADGTVLTVVSAYAHTGDADDADRMAEKLAWFDAATHRLESLRETSDEVLFTGDLNVAHRDSDLKNWKGNVGRAGCHPDERAKFDHWTDTLGWIDVAKHVAGADDVPYTWWSYRGRAFDTDTGWRIDYQFATPGLAERASTARVDRADAYDQRWSDHAPLVATFNL
ncbi:MAG: exodeoxyribonuclease III, partial [Actinomycetes bacterium]